jgi:GTP-binding protein
MRTEFVTSAVDATGFPKERLPELALAGRSNVGKSSLINALVRQKVARTSAAPGKTRLANFYRVTRERAPAFYFVDLPGYGYARGGDEARREFAAITGAYFSAGAAKKGTEPFFAGGGEKRALSPFLRGVLLLVDSRHPGLDADRLAWDWLQQVPVARVVVATKLDKLTRQDRVRHLNELEQLHNGPVLGFSALTGEGLKDLWKTIDVLLRLETAEREPTR